MEALQELQNLKAKYPWLKCDKSLEALERLSKDLPDIVKIIKLQEKQNAIHRRFIEASKFADDAIVKAMIEQYKIKLDGID